jgi:hypothetical protein
MGTTLIMIRAGTCVAPYRAFLQQLAANGDSLIRDGIVRPVVNPSEDIHE